MKETFRKNKFLVPSWVILKSSWVIQGHPGVILGHPGVVSEPFKDKFQLWELELLLSLLKNVKVSKVTGPRNRKRLREELRESTRSGNIAQPKT